MYRGVVVGVFSTLCGDDFIKIQDDNSVAVAKEFFGRRGAVITRLGAIPDALGHTCDRGAKSIADSIEATRCGPYGQKTGGATAAAAGGGGVRVGAEQEEQ